MTDLPVALERLGLHRRFAVDILSVARGVRRVGLLHAPRSAEPGLQAALAASGVCVFARRELVRHDDSDSREGVLRDCKGGEAANFAELWYTRPGEGALPAPEALFEDTGRFLGYPPCCVAEWERLRSQRDLYQRYIFQTTSGHWEINRLATLFQQGLLIPDFFPCSLSCKAARDFAAPFLGLARELLDPAWAGETTRWMRAPVVEYAGALYAFPTWARSGDELELVTADAARVPLAAVGRFDRPQRTGCRLVGFRHLSEVRRAALVGSDGGRTAVVLDRG